LKISKNKTACFFKFGAKVPISIDFVNYFMIYFGNKKATLILQDGLRFGK
jgi:hypothetical protein